MHLWNIWQGGEKKKKKKKTSFKEAFKKTVFFVQWNWKTTPSIMRIKREALQPHRNEEERALCTWKHSLTKPWTTANNYSETECVCVCVHELWILPLTRTNIRCMKPWYTTDPLFVCVGYIIHLNTLTVTVQRQPIRGGFGSALHQHGYGHEFSKEPQKLLFPSQMCEQSLALHMQHISATTGRL